MLEETSIGMLAFGSLIGNPGDELLSLICRRIDNVETPFRVEFARRSQHRDGAPTLVPVDRGGAQVNAAILVLDEAVQETEAKNKLYRRETHNVGRKDIVYRRMREPGPLMLSSKRSLTFTASEPFYIRALARI